jgi:hypothetical protein
MMFGSMIRRRPTLAAGVCVLFSTARAATNEPFDAEGGAAIPPLSAVIARARVHAPGVLVGEAQVTTARSALVGARLPPVGNPYVEVVTKGRPDAVQNVDVDGQLWLPFEVAGQRGTRIDEGTVLVDFQRTTLRYSRAVAVARVIRANGIVTVGAERIRLFGSLLEVARSEAKSYEARYAAGDTGFARGGSPRLSRGCTCTVRT